MQRLRPAAISRSRLRSVRDKHLRDLTRVRRRGQVQGRVTGIDVMRDCFEVKGCGDLAGGADAERLPGQARRSGQQSASFARVTRDNRAKESQERGIL